MDNLSTEIRQPGIYDLDIEDYHKGPGISRSGLLLFRKSPLHYWDKYINANQITQDEKNAFIFGNAFHTYILENAEFTKRYFVLPKLDMRRTADKQIFGILMNENAHKKPILEKDYYLIQEMAERIFKNEEATQLISNCYIEQSFFWNNPEMEMLCKARPDAWHNNMIVDLKTTANAHPDEFMWDCGNYGYHIQAAMIQEAIYNLTSKVIKDFVFLCIEKTRPFAVGIYILHETAIEIGRDEFLGHLKTYKHCFLSKKWPSYTTSEITLPSKFYRITN